MLTHSLNLLAQCHTASCVVSWLNDQLASWSFSEIAALDEACRPTRARDVEDIAHWHAVLTESYCAGGALRPNSDMHQRMMDLFAAAYRRAAQLGLISSTGQDSLAA